MSAKIYWPGAWKRARDQRALAGRAPRLSLRRAIILRETPGGGGEWVAGVFTLKFGKWEAPKWLCHRTDLEAARDVALAAWDRDRLPLLWSREDGHGLRPFYRDINDPACGASA